jgi:segregation and condensation protein B
MDNLTPIETPLTLPAMLEALLFVAPSSVTSEQLAVALGSPVNAIENALDELEKGYTDCPDQHGLRLQRHRGRYQLTSAPQAAQAIEKILGIDAGSRLSRAALEALAIIAYRQPVTRPQMDAIRGVNSDGVLKSLLTKGLIQEVGRAEAPGRPILYATTSEFLQYFGINSTTELPPLETNP